MSPLRSGEPRTDELPIESVDGDAGTSYFEFLEKSAGWNRGRGLLGIGHIVDLAAQTLGAIHRCSNVNRKGSECSSLVSTCDAWFTAASGSAGASSGATSSSSSSSPSSSVVVLASCSTLQDAHLSGTRRIGVTRDVRNRNRNRPTAKPPQQRIDDLLLLSLRSDPMRL